MKHDRELDVDERVAFFKKLAAPTGSRVVLDTGIIGGFDFSALLKAGTLHGPELQDTLSAECLLLNQLHDLFKERGFVFPQEVREEYKLMTKHLEGNGRYNGEHGWYSPMIRARRQLFYGLPRVRELLPRSILPHIPTIEGVVVDISREVYDSNPSLRHARETKKGLAAHALDDEHILAKGFALSYGAPVRVVSGDRDFVEIYRGIALNTDRFIQQGVPSLPKNPFELVFIWLRGSTELFDFTRVRRHQNYKD